MSTQAVLVAGAEIGDPDATRTVYSIVALPHVDHS